MPLQSQLAQAQTLPYLVRHHLANIRDRIRRVILRQDYLFDLYLSRLLRSAGTDRRNGKKHQT